MTFKHLHQQFAFWIIMLIISMITIISALIYFEYHSNSKELEEKSTIVLKDALNEQARRRISLASSVLADNIINPLYNYDMLQMKELLSSTLSEQDIKFIEVFDSKGQIIHDGSELLADYGNLINDQDAITYISDNHTQLLKVDKTLLIAIEPLWLGDDLLGGLRVGLDLSQFEMDVLALSEAFSTLDNQYEKRNTITTVIIAISFIMIALFISVLLARKLAAPIKLLKNYTQSISRGEYDIQFQASRSDEIGDLQIAFQEMGANLSKTTVSRDFVNSIINSMHDALIVIDEDGHITSVNRSSCEMFSSNQSKLTGTPFLNLIDINDRERISVWLNGITADADNITDTRLSSNNSIQTYISLSASTFSNTSSDNSIVCVAQDISERKRHEEHINYLAHFDSLTKLPNRVLFHDRLQHAMAQAERVEQLLALLFIDIDRFKVINDSLGHSAGDELLRQVASRLKIAVRETDNVFRLSGDEFTIILELLHNSGDAELIAQKILDQFREPFVINDQPTFVSASIGIALHPFSDITADELIQQADIAMYMAKESGRSTYKFYTAGLTGYAKQCHALENDLRRALENREFYLDYQPKYTAGSNQLIGVEALLRWKHPIKGEQNCADFIQVLEDIGLIIDVGYWVIEEACRQATEWQKTFPIHVAVNLSTKQFIDNLLVDRICTILDGTKLPHHLLELEITESCLVADVEKSNTLLNKLSSLGISIALDDFGTGYSSLSYLRNFHLDTLKIDKSFIDGLLEDQEAKSICAAIVDLSHQLGMRVVAEGVETEQQLEIVGHMGVDQIQGYLLGRPMAPENITQLLQDRPEDHTRSAG